MRMRPVALVLIFIAVAAACVIAFFLVGVWLGDSEKLDRLALERRVSSANSCDARPLGQRTQTAQERRTTTVAAWILGIREGGHAGWVRQIREGAAMSGQAGMQDWLAQSGKHAADANAAADRMAARLGIRRPPAFGAPGSDTSLKAFRDFVEAGQQPSARGLAEAYSTRLCDVYKLGAYWGFSILFRAAAPANRNVFASEIDFYARRLAMPEADVKSMLDASPAGSDSAQVQAASEQLSKRIAEYWNAQ